MNKRKSLLILLIFFISPFLLGLDYSTGNIFELSSKKLIGSYKVNNKEGSFGKSIIINNTVYAAFNDGGFIILNISDQTKPKRVGIYKEEDSLTQDVFIENNIVYIADWNNGLQIINVSNPSKPLLLGSYNTGNAMQVYASNNIAYVTNWYGDLKLIDVSTPSNPSLLGSINIGNQPGGIYVAGNYAYVGDGQGGGKGFQVIDISDPSSPDLTWQITNFPCRQLMYIDGFIYANAGSIYKIDISTPASPSYEYLFGGESTGAFYIADNKAYVNGDWAGGIDKDGILIVDLISMEIIELYATAGGNFHIENMEFSNGTLYLSLAGRGFYMYDLGKTAVISSLSKKKSTPGGELSVNGKNFGEYQGVVLIKQNDKNQKANIVSWSDEKIDVTLPARLKPGSAVVRIKKSTDLKSRNSKTITIIKSN